MTLKSCVPNVQVNGIEQGRLVMTSSAVTTAAERTPAHYLRKINRFPMLSFEEEQALACRWRD
jgi:hypothetical protein